VSATEQTYQSEVYIELNQEDDLYSHCKQRIAKSGRIFVSKKAWIVRASLLVGMILFMLYNISLALTVGDPLIVYSTLMPIHAIIVLDVGWVFFKNRATGETPEDLVSGIIPVYNQEKLIDKVINAILKST